MHPPIESLLSALSNKSLWPLLRMGCVGLEKESLRVAVDGGISEAPHPLALGSALTNPFITTDYSEALLEFITPPCDSVGQALDFLCDTQTYVQQHMVKEILWATSMPCVVKGEKQIPIATYGSSNAGRMKHLYRVGLGNRYGRVMQVIAGVHFNYSFDQAFWPQWREVKDEGCVPLRAFSDAAYMGLLRNLQRVGWLIPYLFGASPAVCKSFFNEKPTRLQSFDEGTYYEPYATSLRMGDIGYQNRKEEGVGVKANYDSLDTYVASLERAIETPALIWEEIGVKVDGEYRQLNANILQIENEYYSTVRPKQLLEGFEKPSLALLRRGIRYVELRSLDVNAYHPLGVDETQLRFLSLLMLFCLLAESPRISLGERREIDRNLTLVAHRGREPGLHLIRHGSEIRLQTWARDILHAMAPLCDVMGEDAEAYRQTLADQELKVADAEATPSARMLAEMLDRGEGFYQFAHRMSLQHRRYYEARTISPERKKLFDEAVRQSIRRQAEIEAADSMDFDQFLEAYQAQSLG